MKQAGNEALVPVATEVHNDQSRFQEGLRDCARTGHFHHGPRPFIVAFWAGAVAKLRGLIWRPRPTTHWAMKIPPQVEQTDTSRLVQI